jgi:hypothetical protein
VFRQKRNNWPGSGEGGNKPLLNDPRYLEGLMFQSSMPNVAKELVNPGKGDPTELLMRCNLKDERQLNAAVQYLAKCDEFNLVTEKEVLACKLAGTVSIGGLARRELVMAATGIIAPPLYPDVRQKDQSRGDNGKEREKERER